MTCKYSKCDNQYNACEDSIKFGHYKSCGCSIEHFCFYQNEVAYFRGDSIPYPEFLEQMVKDGALPESILCKKDE